MSDRIELDPDEARVRALIRRSDGPVTVRPFRPYASRMSALPVALGAVGLLVIGLVIGTALGARRQEVASPPVATGGIAPSATHTPPTATPEPTASAAPGVPVSAGAVPEAGVLYIQGSDDLMYRYDGRSGALNAVGGPSTFIEEADRGAIAIGEDGRAVLMWWIDAVEQVLCGEDIVLDFARAGACVYREADDRVTVSLPGSAERVLVGETGWRVTAAALDPAAQRVAFLRAVPGASPEERAHNSLWVREPDGRSREVYEPDAATAFATIIGWSPDGRSLVVAETPLVSSSIARDGTRILLVEVATGSAADLGTAFGLEWISWSERGDLAFVRGAGRETWYDKRLIVRAPDGTERELALPDRTYVQLAPSWSATGEIAFVVGPSSADATGYDTSTYMDGTGLGDRRGMVLRADGSTLEIRCPEEVVEGIRPSADGRSFLLLCRKPGEDSYPLSLWYVAPDGSAAVLVRGLGEPYDPSHAGGFGYYGKHPHLETITAWSQASR